MSAIRNEKLEPSTTVLLMVDFVNPLRFDGAEALAPTALQAARQTARLRRRLGADGIRTIYANDNYGRWTSDFKDLWKACAGLPGIPGRMARVVKPGKADFTLLKPRHSAFYATALEILLQQLRCKRLIITGVAADNCVLFTAMDAYLRGYSLWVPADCVAAEGESARDQALEHMARVLKSEVRPAAAVPPPKQRRRV